MLHRNGYGAYNKVLTTDPVKLRVALLAADPPDNAKPARH
jgi:SulP family sulfate permease